MFKETAVDNESSRKIKKRRVAIRFRMATLLWCALAGVGKEREGKAQNLKKEEVRSLALNRRQRQT